jgi:Protein of unknown function (DUF4232)
MSTSSRASVLRRRVAWLAAAGAATALLAACGSPGSGQPASPSASGPSSSSPSASSAPVTSAPVTSPPAAAPAPASPTAAPSGGAALAACRTATLRITLDVSQASATAGSTYYPLNFTNTSASSCELYGYPGVSFAAASTAAAEQIGAAARRNGAFGKLTVRLAPGATAHAWLQVAVAGNYPPSACQPVTADWLRVYPPGETVAGYVTHTFNACSSASTALLTVLPVRAGQALAGVTP